MWKKTKKKIIKNVINTSFVKKKINYILMDIFSFVVKVHINSIICLCISCSIAPINFVTELCVSLLLYYYGNVFNNFIYIYENKFFKVTNYFIDNYSKKNIDLWKKKTLLCVNLYLILILYCVNITSNILIVYSIQYMFYLIILDYINNKKWKESLKKFKNWYYKPESFKFVDKIEINEDYLLTEDDKNECNILTKYISKSDMSEINQENKKLVLYKNNINSIKSDFEIIQ